MKSFLSEQFIRLLALRGELQRFLMLGVFSYGLGLGVSVFLREVIRFSEEVSVACSLAILVLVNFWVSRRHVFRAEGDPKRQFMLFAVTSLAMRGAEYLGFYLLLQWVGLHYLVALTVAMIVSSSMKFFIYRSIVFSKAKSV